MQTIFATINNQQGPQKGPNMEIAVFYYREMSVAATSPSAFLFKKNYVIFYICIKSYTFIIKIGNTSSKGLIQRKNSLAETSMCKGI